MSITLHLFIHIKQKFLTPLRNQLLLYEELIKILYLRLNVWLINLASFAMSASTFSPPPIIFEEFVMTHYWAIIHMPDHHEKFL